MDAKDFYLTCLGQASDIAKQVRRDQFANQTPDDNWSVRDLLNHMLNEIVWVPDMLAGRTILEVGNDHDGDTINSDASNSDIDLVVVWETAAGKAERAVEGADTEATAHLSYADVAAGDYLYMTGGDILVHTWDLAKAINVAFVFNTKVAEQMWQGVKDRDMSDSGLFKNELPYADSDSAQDKILAKFGRNKDWSNT